MQRHELTSTQPALCERSVMCRDMPRAAAPQTVQLLGEARPECTWPAREQGATTKTSTTTLGGIE